MFSSFFFVFFNTIVVLLYIQIVIHYRVILGQRRRQEEPKRRWALVECFFFLVFFDTNECFIAYTGCNSYNTRKGECSKETTTRKSPNDASGVVWSLGGSFFLSFFVFSILM